MASRFVSQFGVDRGHNSSQPLYRSSGIVTSNDTDENDEDSGGSTSEEEDSFEDAVDGSQSVYAAGGLEGMQLEQGEEYDLPVSQVRPVTNASTAHSRFKVLPTSSSRIASVQAGNARSPEAASDSSTALLALAGGTDGGSALTRSIPAARTAELDSMTKKMKKLEMENAKLQREVRMACITVGTVVV